MAKLSLVISSWIGGTATDSKEGILNSFAYGRHLDFRKSASSLTVLPKTVKESSTVVTDLITDMVQLPSGKIVAIGDAGGVYTRTTGGTWAKNGTTLDDTAAGMVYNFQHDTIYIPGLDTVHSITNADGRFSGGTFTVNNNTFTASKDQEATSSANTYTTLDAISETATNRQTFSPDYEPLYSIKVWVTTKGTGDLTVTVHDAANNLLGSKTVAVGSITDGALNEFVFTTPIRMLASPNPGTYHFHVTHDGAGTASTIGTATSSDLEDGRFESYADRLVDPVNNFHPAIQFLNFICIGNERYLTVWEPISQSAPSNTEWQRHKLTFEPGYEVCGLALYNEFLAIACEKRSTSGTTDIQDGKIFLWNGVSASPDFSIPCPEGAPYSLFGHKNVLYWTAGGAWWAYAGGQPVKLKTFPNTDSEYSDATDLTIVNPHMADIRRGIFLQGYPTQTSNLSLQHGVYSWGSIEKNYPDSLGYSYTISTGTRLNTGSNNLRIGCIKNFGDTLLISWRDSDTTYGVDVVNNSSDPFASATYESLIFDNGRPDKEKLAHEMIVTFETLPTGATVTPKYKINREANWNSGTAAVAGDSKVSLNITGTTNSRFREIQFALDLVATTTTPKITGITFVFDPLLEEND